jgi:quercetin dioxygenase-like cupin family protein
MRDLEQSSFFEDVRAVAPQTIWDGIAARVVDGERITMAVVELDPKSVVPEHRHENEQLGVVLSGSLVFRIGEDVRELGPGALYRIPANTPHAVDTGPEGAVVVDIFSPVRDDWRPLPRESPREPRWPR